jgi:hypothetical protein
MGGAWEDMGGAWEDMGGAWEDKKGDRRAWADMTGHKRTWGEHIRGWDKLGGHADDETATNPIVI